MELGSDLTDYGGKELSLREMYAWMKSDTTPEERAGAL